ncbi:hypothetical protein MTO96_033582 [Rhipicephalus appendiculatus]
MEHGRQKRMVLRAQATRLINDCEQARQLSLTPNEAGVLRARLASIRTELDAANNEMETLVSEDDLEGEYTQVTEYNDRIVQCLARLEQRANGGSKQACPAQPAQAIHGDVTETTEHMKKLIYITPVRTSDDVRGLRRLYDTVSAHIRGLETLGRKLDSFSSLLLPIVQRATPREILLDFRRKCVVETCGPINDQQATTDGSSLTTEEGDRGTVNTFSRLLSFLRVEVESRENLAALQSMDFKKAPKYSAKEAPLTARKGKGCSICCKCCTRAPPKKSASFITLAATQRKTVAKRE